MNSPASTEPTMPSMASTALNKLDHFICSFSFRVNSTAASRSDGRTIRLWASSHGIGAVELVHSPKRLTVGNSDVRPGVPMGNTRRTSGTGPIYRSGKNVALSVPKHYFLISYGNNRSGSPGLSAQSKCDGL